MVKVKGCACWFKYAMIQVNRRFFGFCDLVCRSVSKKPHAIVVRGKCVYQAHAWIVAAACCTRQHIAAGPLWYAVGFPSYNA